MKPEPYFTYKLTKRPKRNEFAPPCGHCVYLHDIYLLHKKKLNTKTVIHLNPLYPCFLQSMQAHFSSQAGTEGRRVKTVLARADRATNGTERHGEFRGSVSLWSVTVELNGVHWGGDCAASITATLLLGLLMPERFALGKFKHVVGLLAPVTVGSHLE